MFLDEELEQILFAKELKTKEDVAELSRDLLKCMINRVPKPSEVSTHAILFAMGKEELNEDESFVNTFSSLLNEAISTMEE